MILEFALVSIPFFSVLLASLTTSLVYFGQQSLESATEVSARLIITGEAKSQGLTSAQFKSKACAALPDFMPCSNLFVDVRTAAAFNQASTGAPRLTYGPDGNVKDDFSYNYGNGGDIVVVRLMYVWQLPAVSLGYNLSTMPNGKRLLISTTVAKSETYK